VDKNRDCSHSRSFGLRADKHRNMFDPRRARGTILYHQEKYSSERQRMCNLRRNIHLIVWLKRVVGEEQAFDLKTVDNWVKFTC
jgi:hypothetical protein